MIDSHAHLTDQRFSQDLEAVIRRAREEGVSRILDIGDGVDSSRRSAELAGKHGFIFSAAGIHPHGAGGTERLADLEELLSREKVVAVGETGLDYYRGLSGADRQRALFEESVAMACRRGLPVIVHCRSAADDVHRILRRFPAVSGVMHCFSGGADEAERFLEIGMYISFAGNVTFPRADPIRAAAAAVPLDRILLETDSPYLAPQAVRGKRNEPAYIRHVYRFVAGLRSISPAELAEAVSLNFSKLFGIEPEGGSV